MRLTTPRSTVRAPAERTARRSAERPARRSAERPVHRPALERLTLALLGFLGVTATAGGGAFLLGPTEGEAAWFPSEWLDELPLVDSFVLPGLVLGVGFGLGSLGTLWGMLRRPHWAVLGWAERLTGMHWSWLATVALGVGHMAWIGLELAYLDFSALHAVYGAVGVALAVTPFAPPMRRALAVR